MEVNIADLTWASFIYPRGGKNEETVKAYVEALRIGAKFPPIKIQRVFKYPGDNEKTEAALILDGVHRWSAFKECGFKKMSLVLNAFNAFVFNSFVFSLQLYDLSHKCSVWNDNPKV